MELNRNQFFLIGLVVLFLGIELRLVDTFILNEKATHFIASRTKAAGGAGDGLAQLFPSVGPIPRKSIQPPPWMGWALVSLGSVLILHSLAMKRPGG